MFDIGWQELFIVAVIALIVVGPKDLPQAIRAITTWIRKAKMMTREFQAGVNEMVREAELDGIKDTLTKPHDVKQSIVDIVDPDGELQKGMSLSEDDLKADPKPEIDEPMTIGEAIDAGIVTPEADSEADDSGMAVKRKPKPTPARKPKPKAKPKPRAKPKPKPRAKPKAKTDTPA